MIFNQPAGKDSTICSSSSAQLGYAAKPGHTYSWTKSGGGFTSSKSNPTVSPTSTTSYYLTETITATGKTKTDTAIVTVNPLPTPNAGVDTNQCNGSSTTIGTSSTGGHTYSWTSSPGGFTSSTSNPSVSPTVTTNYYVTETITATGCHKADTCVVHVSPSPPTLSSIASKKICQEVPTTLSASKCDSFTFVWYKGATALPANFCSINTLDAGTYSFTSTFAFVSPSTKTCSNTSSSIALTTAPNMAITYASGTLTISSTSTAYYTNFKWYKNTTSFGGTSSTQATSGDGYYYATGQDSCGSVVTSNIIKLDIGCGAVGSLPSPYNGYANGPTTYTTNTTVSSNTYYQNTVTISNGASVTISASDILMGSCTQFIVSAGCTLTITGTTVHSCATWKGIDVKGITGGTGPGTLTIQSGALIKDAIMAVLAEKDANISVTASTFRYNETHLAFNNGSLATSSATVYGNTFANLAPVSSFTGGCSSPITLTNSPLKMIYINNISGITIGNSTGGNANTFMGNPYSGIHGNESAIESYGAITSLNFDYNTIDGAIIQGAFLSSGGGISFTHNSIGAHGSLIHPLNAVVLTNVTGSTFNDNIIDSTGVRGIGMQFLQNLNGASTSTISGNTFAHNHIGLAIAPFSNPVIDPVKTSTTKINNPSPMYTINANITCNAFSNNDVGIAGSGQLMNQGSSTDDQGNQFYVSGSPHKNNNDYDIIWRKDPYTGGSYGIIYYDYGSAGEDPNGSYPSKPTTKYALNYDGSSSPYTPHIMGSAGDVDIHNTASGANGCYGTAPMQKQGSGIIKSDTSVKTSEPAFVNRFYPNPFTEHFTVEFGDASQQYLIDVYDMTGRKVLSRKVENAHQVDIDGSGLAPSTYTLTITAPNGNIEHYKMVKVKN